MKIDFLPLMCEAFSTNPKTYKKIDILHKEDRYNFHKLAKQSKWYNHPIAQEGNIEQEYYFKKMLGILIAADTNANLLSDDILNIISFGWKYVFTYIQNHNTVSVTLFLESFIKKKKGLENISDDEINSNVLMLLVLAVYFKKDIDTSDEFYSSVMHGYVLRLQHYNSKCRINIDNVVKEKKKELRRLELKIRNNKKVNFIPSSYRLTKEQHTGIQVNLNKLNKDDKFFLAFEYLFDLENISLISLVENNYFNSKEAQEIIYCYTHLFDDTELNYSDLLQFIYPAIQIRYLCQEYKQAKKFFFENFDDSLYEEINILENKNSELKTHSLVLENENIVMKQKLEQLEKKLSRAEKEIMELSKDKEETIKLRAFIFNLDNVEDYSDEHIDYSKLKTLNATIIGGHPQWQSKMKEYLPNCNFISIDNINFDVDILKKSDYIFVYVNYLSHSLYYKVINEVRNNNLKIDYLKSNTNNKLILTQIFKAICQ